MKDETKRVARAFARLLSLTGFPPTRREIVARLQGTEGQLRSTSTVSYHYDKLVKLGVMVKGKGRSARGIEMVGTAVAVPRNILHSTPFKEMVWVYIDKGAEAPRMVGQAQVKFAVGNTPTVCDECDIVFGCYTQLAWYIRSTTKYIDREQVCIVSSHKNAILAGTAAGINVYPPSWLQKESSNE